MDKLAMRPDAQLTGQARRRERLNRVIAATLIQPEAQRDRTIFALPDGEL